ncbi:hypothetical protein ACFWIJ_02205 [Streptomyces sp. NPDC127079]|uniref:hypothetical protein n=1 Tax=Streptomyces sp. NPDC127079 TaxID=3347132 RepID=UPI00365BF735
MDGLPDPHGITPLEAVEAFNQRRWELTRIHQEDPDTALLGAQQAVEWAMDVVAFQEDELATVPLQMSIAALSSDLAFVAIESGQPDIARIHVNQAVEAIAAVQAKIEPHQAALEPCRHGNLSYRGKCTSMCPRD